MTSTPTEKPTKRHTKQVWAGIILVLGWFIIDWSFIIALILLSQLYVVPILFTFLISKILHTVLLIVYAIWYFRTPSAAESLQEDL